MKRNVKFFTIVISLLLLSSIILTGCMYAIAADNGEMKPYDLNGQINNSDSPGGNIVEDAPLAQSAMQEKFSAYLHTDGNAVTVFSDEQYAQLKAIREGGKRTPLNYDEILFLVNDSINLYFTYDEIRLTNAVVDGISHNLFLSSNAEVIYPYHGDYSDLKNYAEAEQKYQKMLEDIYSIIYYRIYMHDAGFATVFHAQDGQIWGESTADDPRDLIQFDRYQLLAIDGAADSGIKNEEKLIKAYKTLLEQKQMPDANVVVGEEVYYPHLGSAVLYTQTQYSRGASFYEFFIAGPKDAPAQQIYPTVELVNKMPQREFIYQAGNDDGPVFSLNYETGKCFLSASMYMSFAMGGEFDLHDGVLKMHFGDDSSYVFNESGNGFVYSKENSKPATYGGFDFADGLVFECILEGVSTSPNPDDPENNTETKPPVNNPVDNQNEYKIQHFKFGDGLCSLIADGESIEGTYLHEGDAHVLYFDGGYQYVFYYNEDVGYVFCKSESNAIPGYELEDETIFNLVDGYILEFADK